MEDTKTALDNDLAELREAVDKFLLKHENSSDENYQVIHLVDLLKELKVAGVLKSQDDYDEYTTSTDYYDSNC